MSIMVTKRQPQTCVRCGETKPAWAFGCVSGGRQLNTVCRQCNQAAVRKLRIERAIANNRKDQWFALTDDDRHECNVCHLIKGQAEFARGGGEKHGGGLSRWRRLVCKLCVRAARTVKRPEPTAEWRGGKEASVKMYACPWCRSQGIISPLPTPLGPCVPECGYGAAGAFPRPEVAGEAVETNGAANE